MTNQVGGWSSLVTPDQFTQGMKQAEEAFGSLLGVSYQPLAAQEQVVEGMNYCYFCKAQVVSPGSSAYLARVLVYVAPGANPIVTAVERILP